MHASHHSATTLLCWHCLYDSHRHAITQQLSVQATRCENRLLLVLLVVAQDVADDGRLARHLVRLGRAHAAAGQHLVHARLLGGQVRHALLHRLLQHLDVHGAVGGVVAGEVGHLGLHLLQHSLGVLGVLEALDDVGQSLHACKALVGLQLLLDVLEHLLGGACRVVVHGVVLGGGLAARQPLNGGEAAHLKLVAQGAVGVGVHLRNDHTVLQLGIVLDQLTQLLVLRHQVLAVPAPGSIELNERSLCAIDNLVEVVRGQVLHAGQGLRGVARSLDEGGIAKQ
mmetsp:Transcript_29741/g.75760  ORF Transcript_29741/g.75760 Transcript_29741/m.75760 type:complete len:283 (-) Transcript_29741:47-895(-)